MHTGHTPRTHTHTMCTHRNQAGLSEESGRVTVCTRPPGSVSWGSLPGWGSRGKRWAGGAQDEETEAWGVSEPPRVAESKWGAAISSSGPPLLFLAPPEIAHFRPAGQALATSGGRCSALLSHGATARDFLSHRGHHGSLPCSFLGGEWARGPGGGGG